MNLHHGWIWPSVFMPFACVCKWLMCDNPVASQNNAGRRDVSPIPSSLLASSSSILHSYLPTFILESGYYQEWLAYLNISFDFSRGFSNAVLSSSELQRAEKGLPLSCSKPPCHICIAPYNKPSSEGFWKQLWVLLLTAVSAHSLWRWIFQTSAQHKRHLCSQIVLVLLVKEFDEYLVAWWAARGCHLSCALSIRLSLCPDPCPLSLHGSECQHPTGARARNLPRDLGPLARGPIEIFFHFPKHCLGLAAEYHNFTLWFSIIALIFLMIAWE